MTGVSNTINNIVKFLTSPFESGKEEDDIFQGLQGEFDADYATDRNAALMPEFKPAPNYTRHERKVISMPSRGYEGEPRGYEVIVFEPRSYNESKQISRTHTYSLASSDFDEIKIKLHNVINELLDEVNFDEIKPKQITLKLRYEKHKITSKTKTLFDQSTINSVNVYSYALELFLDLWNENPIKGIAISLGKL